MTKDLGSEAKKGVFWTASFNLLQYVIRFGSSIALARILFPEDFGLMGIAMIVIQFARRLANFGFNLVLIQREEIKNEHYDTVFVMNTLLMGSITILLMAMSNYLAHFFNEPRLQPILMVVALDFVIKALFSVPFSILARNMRFKELGIARTYGSLIGLTSPVIFALMGMGVWSLVIGNLIGNFVTMLFTYLYTHWLPKFKFRLWALKDVFAFGLWVYINNYINYLRENIDYLIIAKFINPVQLGYYERAFNLMEMPTKRIGRTVHNVLFSAYAKIQNDNERLINAMLKVTTTISFIAYPIMVWLFFAAPSFIVVLYGEKWHPTILPLQIMCISGLIGIMTMIFDPVIMAKGLVGERARREFLYVLIMAGAIFYFLKWGIVGVALGVVVGSLFIFIFLFQLLHKAVGLSVSRFFKAQRSSLFYAGNQILILLLTRLVVGKFYSNESWQMLLTISLMSILSYLGSHFVFRFKDVDSVYREILSDLKNFVNSVIPHRMRVNNLFLTKIFHFFER